MKPIGCARCARRRTTSKGRSLRYRWVKCDSLWFCPQCARALGLPQNFQLLKAKHGRMFTDHLETMRQIVMRPPKRKVSLPPPWLEQMFKDKDHLTELKGERLWKLIEEVEAKGVSVWRYFFSRSVREILDRLWVDVEKVRILYLGVRPPAKERGVLLYHARNRIARKLGRSRHFAAGIIGLWGKALEFLPERPSWRPAYRQKRKKLSPLSTPDFYRDELHRKSPTLEMAAEVVEREIRLAGHKRQSSKEKWSRGTRRAWEKKPTKLF